MGQYYKAVNIDKKEYVRPHAYDNGAKLLEHSYIENNFLGVVTNLLKKEWKGDRVIWLGDYFEKDENPALPIDNEMTEKFDELTPKATIVKNGFLNNLTKKISIDLSKVTAQYDLDDPDYKIHPLSILTACGNGRGGGDLNDDKHYLTKLAGTWAGDNLSVTTKPQFKTSLFFNNVTQSVEFITEEETETMMSAIKNVTEALTKHKSGGTRMATLKKATKKSAPKAKATKRVAKKAPAKKTKTVRKVAKKAPAKKAKATKIIAKVKLSNRKVAKKATAKKAKTVRKAPAKRATKKAPPIANPVVAPIVN